MYLIRRTFKIQKGKTRDAAEAAKQISAKYQGEGQRTPVWIYISGPTTPGPSDTIYMDWVEEKLENPYREENESIEGLRDLFQNFNKYFYLTNRGYYCIITVLASVVKWI